MTRPCTIRCWRRPFAQRFEKAQTDWQLERETEIVNLKETVMIPDFVFRHPDGRTALLEIVGVWQPEQRRGTIPLCREYRPGRSAPRPAGL
ncbi:MAG: DUF790 family protein [Candidatus Handelsmanbacteria bacterium]|nr:DUF790 family protein [Candidatus Handelsmanbacteria bacterium]